MNSTFEYVRDAQQVIQFLEDRLYDYNAAALGKHDGALFSWVLRDDDKKIVAGVAGWTWAGICEITQLWVHESLRKKGIGKKLLEAAEAEAKSKGCYKLLVRSYGFQAPHFYKRYGYNVEHELKDFPRGFGYYILLKNLPLQSRRV